MRYSNRFLPLLLTFLLTLTSCGSDTKGIRKFNLIVTNGTGSGLYSAGTSVFIVANAALDKQQFDVWTKDANQVADAKNPSTTITVPAKDSEVIATYKNIDYGTPVSIIINNSTKYQTIDGFGFFGAYDVWWGSVGNMWNDAWGEKVISDLGISIWRNEYFPPSTPTDPQDANWEKQKSVVAGLKTKADKYNVNLKFIFTVWSPPADLKWQSSFTWPGDANATRRAGTVSSKNGGTLNPNKYTEYADWLKAGIQLYKDVGIDVYALSLQNELMFTQTFNSCTYTFNWYNDLVKEVVPRIKTVYPQVKIFGAENMLDMEGAANNWPVFYHANLKANTTAAANIDILAVHGYNDGVAASSGLGLAERWTNHSQQFSTPMNKPAWMTETSGYNDSWENSGGKPGALALAQDIHAGLFYGNMSAWVWWQGSGGPTGSIGEFELMKGMVVGKKYAASKHFYRYIRPGTIRVQSATSDASILATAYEHPAKNTKTIIVINSGTTDKLIWISGSVGASYAMYRTNGGSENCSLISTISAGLTNAIVIPAKSIITLQAGGDSL